MPPKRKHKVVKTESDDKDYILDILEKYVAKSTAQEEGKEEIVVTSTNTIAASIVGNALTDVHKQRLKKHILMLVDDENDPDWDALRDSKIYTASIKFRVLARNLRELGKKAKEIRTWIEEFNKDMLKEDVPDEVSDGERESSSGD